jgi:hypothetical protein
MEGDEEFHRGKSRTGTPATGHCSLHYDSALTHLMSVQTDIPHTATSGVWMSKSMSKISVWMSKAKDHQTPRSSSPRPIP